MNNKSNDKNKKQRTPAAAAVAADSQTHTDFSYNLDACVVQGSRRDRDKVTSGPGVVESVWITSRPPRVGRGVEPTVSARRAYVMLTHVQGQQIDTGELVCKKVCTISGSGNKPNEKDAVNTAAAKNPNRQASACARGGITCD